MKGFTKLTELKGNSGETFSTGKTICIQTCRISYLESAYEISDNNEIQTIKDDHLRWQALNFGYIGSRIVLIDMENNKPKEFFVVENPFEI